MRLLLFGANGQVGTEIRLESARRGVTLEAVDRETCDLTQPGSAAALIERTEACDGVINAAAYTAVDKAESEAELAEAVNAYAPGEMAEACVARGIPLIHYSTDYVFAGDATTPYRENDPTGPLGVYGRSKLEGEARVLAAGGHAAIVRLAWVFSAHGGNFVKTMLRVGKERGHLRVVDDQIGKPTPAAPAARAALDMIAPLAADTLKSGIYHFSGDRALSWAAFAREIFEVADLDVTVEPITTAEYPTPAKRPAWSVLDTAKIENTFGIAAPDWRAELEHVIAAL